jgi:hypothetical protein
LSDKLTGKGSAASLFFFSRISKPDDPLNLGLIGQILLLITLELQILFLDHIS